MVHRPRPVESRDDICITFQELPVLNRIQQVGRDQPDAAKSSDGEGRGGPKSIPTFKRSRYAFLKEG